MAGSPSVLPGNIAGAVGRWIQQGLNATDALRAFKAAGGAIRTQTWYQLYRNTADALGRAGEVARTPTNRRPSEDAFSPWATLKPNQYAYQVTVMVRDRDSGILTQRPYTYFSASRVTPNVAIQDALDTYNDGISESDDYASESIEGAVLTGLFRTVPIERGPSPFG